MAIRLTSLLVLSFAVLACGHPDYGVKRPLRNYDQSYSKYDFDSSEEVADKAKGFHKEEEIEVEDEPSTGYEDQKEPDYVPDHPDQKDTYKEPDYVSEIKESDYVPEVKEPDYIPEVKEPDYVPEVKEPDYIPEVKVPDYVPEVKEPDYVSEQKEPDYIPEVKEPDYVPEQKEPDYVPEVKEPDYIPEVKEPDYIPEVKEPEYVPEQKEPDYVSEVKEPDYVPEQKEPDYIPEVKEPDYIPDRKDSYPYEDKEPDYVPEEKKEKTWIQCSLSCDGGVQRREIKCLNHLLQPSIGFAPSTKPDSRQYCNTLPCEWKDNRLKNEVVQSSTQYPKDSATYPYSPTSSPASDNRLKNEVVQSSTQYPKDSATYPYSPTSSPASGVYVHPSCTDNPYLSNCKLIVKAKYCTTTYYARFCCRSCTLAGQLPSFGSHLQDKPKRSKRK